MFAARPPKPQLPAAEKILTQETKGKLAGELIAKGIEDVRKKLN